MLPSGQTYMTNTIINFFLSLAGGMTTYVGLRYIFTSPVQKKVEVRK